MRLIKLAVLAAIPLLSSPVAQAQDTPRQESAHSWSMSCTDRYAHEAAQLTYLEAKLNLTDKQHAAWVKWSQWELQGAQQERDACQALQPKDHPHLNALEKEAAKEKQLQMRLQTLQNARPALQELYALLSAEQKEVMDHGSHSQHRKHHD